LSEQRVALALTGASAIRVGLRVAQALADMGYKLEIVVTQGAYEVAQYEEGLDPNGLRGVLGKYGAVYGEHDYSSPLASSSSIPRTMIVVPASMKTLGLAAAGIPLNLVVRAMLSVLRLGGTLVVAPRETPLGVAEIRNMLTLAEMGARIVPLNIAFYIRPRSLDDVIDFLAGKVLDAAGIENELYRRWAQK